MSNRHAPADRQWDRTEELVPGKRSHRRCASGVWQVLVEVLDDPDLSEAQPDSMSVKVHPAGVGGRRRAGGKKRPPPTVAASADLVEA